MLHTSKRSARSIRRNGDDRAALDRLVAGADIVVIGHPRELEAWLGCGVDALAGAFPQLVVVAISWFGGSGPVVGPRRDRVHAAGVVRLDRQPWSQARPPVATGGRIGEWVAGAVAGRRRAGDAPRRAADRPRRPRRRLDARGDDDRVQPVPGGRGAVRRAWPRARGDPRFVDVPSVEPTADGWVGFATNGTAQFRAFAELVGHPEWGDHPELGRVDRRGEHDRELRAEIAAWTTARTTDEVVALAGERRIPVAPSGTARRCRRRAVRGPRRVRRAPGGGMRRSRASRTG